MKTILFSDASFCGDVLKASSPCELSLMASLRCYDEMDLEVVKEKCKVGDFITVSYKDKVIPFQILKKNEDRSLEILSYYILEERKFDKETNIWRDSEIRKYLNSEFLENFDDDLISHLKEKDVHTEDYITKDRVWLLSHEEVNCKKSRYAWFKHNKNCFAYSAFSDDESRKRMNFSCTPCNWWLRSAHSYYSSLVGSVYDGYVDYDYANYDYGVLPACTIC